MNVWNGGWGGSSPRSCSCIRERADSGSGCRSWCMPFPRQTRSIWKFGSSGFFCVIVFWAFAPLAALFPKTRVHLKAENQLGIRWLPVKKVSSFLSIILVFGLVCVVWPCFLRYAFPGSFGRGFSRIAASVVAHRSSTR